MYSESDLIRVTYVPVDVPEQEWYVEHNFIEPAVGHGVVDEKGARWRIVDIWVVHEKHSGGLNPYGVYAFVEQAHGDDDRPGQMYPEYYQTDVTPSGS